MRSTVPRSLTRLRWSALDDPNAFCTLCPPRRSRHKPEQHNNMGKAVALTRQHPEEISRRTVARVATHLGRKSELERIRPSLGTAKPLMGTCNSQTSCIRLP